MNQDLPIINVILLNWNGLEDTLECLASLQMLTYPSIKVTVVDNASRDGQAETIEERFPEAVVLKQRENLGFCGGCNVGIRHAIANGADYVMLLNNDTIVPPDLIDQLLGGVALLDNFGAVSPIVFNYPETSVISVTNVRWDPMSAKFNLRYDVDGGQNCNIPYRTDFACGCCLLTSTESFVRVGLLDERYFAFFDEADWCARARRKGYESYMIPNARVFHKGTRSTPSLVTTYLMTRNRLLWMKDNLRFKERIKSYPLIIKEIIWHVANLAGMTGKTYSKQHSRAALLGYKDFLMGKFYKWNEKTSKVIFADSN